MSRPYSVNEKDRSVASNAACGVWEATQGLDRVIEIFETPRPLPIATYLSSEAYLLGGEDELSIGPREVEDYPKRLMHTERTWRVEASK